MGFILNTNVVVCEIGHGRFGRKLGKWTFVDDACLKYDDFPHVAFYRKYPSF